MSSPPVLFGIENPLLDITAHVELDMVKKYGAEFGNAILATEKHLPVYEELTSNYKCDYTAGGSTLNVLRTFQWMLQKGPNKSTFVGCIGKDQYGKTLVESAQKDGVVPHFLEDDETQTGTCACLVVGSERSLIANLGAANKYKHEHLLMEHTQQHLKNAKYYYSSGFFLTVSPESMLHVAEHAAQHDKVFMTNLSAIFISQFFKEPLLKVLPFADYIFGNDDEARAFAKSMEWNTEDVQDIATRISQLDKKNKKRSRVVVITQADKPVVTAIYDYSKVHTKQFEVPKVQNIVDSNGAGDSFCGGFISQLVQGKELEECVKAGIYASSVIIQRSGCTFPEKPNFTP